MQEMTLLQSKPQVPSPQRLHHFPGITPASKDKMNKLKKKSIFRGRLYFDLLINKQMIKSKQAFKDSAFIWTQISWD